MKRHHLVLVTVAAMAGSYAIAGNNININQLEGVPESWVPNLYAEVDAALSAINNIPQSVVDEAVDSISTGTDTVEEEVRVSTVTPLVITDNGDITWGGVTTETNIVTTEVPDGVYDLSGIQPIVDAYFFGDGVGIDDLNSVPWGSHEGQIGVRVDDLNVRIEDLRISSGASFASQDWTLFDQTAEQITEDIATVNNDIQSIRDAYERIDGIVNGIPPEL